MKLIDPLTVTDAAFNSAASNIVPEDPATEWTAGTYSTDDIRFKATTHRRYQVVADPSTTDDPEVGVLADPPTWIDLGATNRWAMFDTIIENQSTNPLSITFEVTPGEIVNTVSLLNLSGTTANITATDPTIGEYYNRDFSLISTENVFDFYSYCFAPFRLISDIVALNIPPYAAGIFTVTVDSDTTAKIGEFVYGVEFDLGISLQGATPGIESFSIITTDTFGQTSITKRSNRKLMTIDTVVDTVRINNISRKMGEVIDKLVLWVGDENNDSLIVYGILGNFTPPFGIPGGKSFINYEIKGVI